MTVQWKLKRLRDEVGKLDTLFVRLQDYGHLLQGSASDQWSGCKSISLAVSISMHNGRPCNEL